MKDKNTELLVQEFIQYRELVFLRLRHKDLPCVKIVVISGVHTGQALRMCEDRQVEVDASEVSHVSWHRADDLGRVEAGLRRVGFRR